MSNPGTIQKILGRHYDYGNEFRKYYIDTSLLPSKFSGKVNVKMWIKKFKIAKDLSNLNVSTAIKIFKLWLEEDASNLILELDEEICKDWNCSDYFNLLENNFDCQVKIRVTIVIH
jgi:hypothetical protein